MKINKKNIKMVLPFSYILIYVLMRPFLTSYVSVYCKYLFVVLVLMFIFLSLMSKRCVNIIGRNELILISILYVYIIINAIWYGGVELFSQSLTAYILYTFPIIVFPFITKCINWDNVLKFLSFFGAVDAIISITEFLTRQRMFPKVGIEGNVDILTSAGTRIVRTYGFQGSFFILADILCLCAFSSWYLYRYNKGKLYLILWMIISLGILSTGSRGYYVSYFIGMVTIIFFENKVNCVKKKMTLIKLSCYIIAILLILLVLYVIFFSDYITGIKEVDVVIDRIRMITDWQTDSANLKRVSIWNWALDYWKESMLTGHGACCTDLSYSKYISVTESGVLKRFVELGIIGTILQYITMIMPIRRGIKKIKQGQSDTRILVSIGVIITYLVEDCVLQRYTNPEYTIILWFAIASFAYAEKKNCCY